MTGQAFATLAVAAVSAVQAFGMWSRRKYAKKQYHLDKEKFAYRKFLDKLNNVNVYDFEREFEDDKR